MSWYWWLASLWTLSLVVALYLMQKSKDYDDDQRDGR